MVPVIGLGAAGERGQGVIGDALLDLESVVAHAAFVFVGRHGFLAAKG
jgi:hypothetical protein